MAKHIIREANQEDLSDITRLRHTIKEFRPIETEEYRSFWNSKTYSNPHSIRNVYVAVNEEGKITSHLAMIPYMFLNDGEQLYGGNLCEQMVHEDYRQELLFPRIEMQLLNKYKSLGVDFAYGMANREEMVTAHLAFGFRKIGDLEVYAKPYKLTKVARSRVKNPILKALLTPLLYIAEKALGLRNVSAEDGPESAEVSSFGPEMDKYLEDVQSNFPCSAVRSSKILNWRFAVSSGVSYYRFVAMDKGEIVGYTVLRRVAIKGFDALAVIDIMFSPERPDAGRALLSAVDGKARELGVDLSTCLLNPFDPRCTVMKKCGYLKTPETFALIIHEPRGSEPRFTEETFSSWHLTWFEHDAL